MFDWTTIKLGDVISIKHGFAFKGEYFSDTGPGPILVTPGNFAIGGGFKEGRVKYYHGPAIAGYDLSPGDLIVTMTDLSKGGDTLGYPAIIPSGPQYLHNQRIGLVQIHQDSVIDKRFLSYALRTAAYRAHVLGSATGSTVRHTSPSRIEAYSLKVPQLVEQVAIGSILGSLDDKIAINETIAAKAHLIAELTFRLRTKSANLTPMSSVLTPVLGATPSRKISDYWGGGIPWASARDVATCTHGTVLETAEQISDRAALETKAKPVPPGAVILTARGTLGAVARVIRPTSFNQSCFAFIPDNIPESVLYFMVRAAAAQMASLAQGTVFSTINMSTFNHIGVPVLSEYELQELESSISPLLDTVQCRLEENLAVRALRDALLPKLISGKIRVRDAEKIVEEVV
ncbi:restriction endonuclease subunit S [Nocardia sp. NPDC050406]|uniref:restriction endonuclease subunit S n=1 Tax=Nocardia sp. NPDC050406 TaxID=3364318 RepID=UPI00379AB9AC